MKAGLFGMASLAIGLCFGTSTAQVYYLGAIETVLLKDSRPRGTNEILALGGRLATSPGLRTALALLPGEITAIPQAYPSNAALGRLVQTNWTVFAYDSATGLVVPNVNVSLSALRHQPFSGGHDHDSLSRPKGALS